MGVTHPARFSPEIVRVLRELLLADHPAFFGRPKLWDPFAGSGERLAEIAGGEFNYGGTEIEEAFIIDERILCGDATDPTTYPTQPYCIVTSPAYPNGMSDHHKINDTSKRYTYRAAIKALEGRDRPLHPSNMGAYGYRSSRRGSNSAAREAYWTLANAAVKNWASADVVYLNVSDFMAKRKGVLEVEPVVGDWQELLIRHGWGHQDVLGVGTRRMRNGENRDVRVDGEKIIVARRA